MRLTKMMGFAVLGPALGLGLVACGGDGESAAKKPDTTAFCDAIEAARADISGFTSPTGSPDYARFNDVVAEIQGIAKLAPQEAKTNWTTLSTSVTKLTEALDSAGTDLAGVIGAVSTGKLPEGVTAEEMTALGGTLGTLQSPQFTKVTEAIGTQTKSICGIDMAAAS